MCDGRTHAASHEQRRVGVLAGKRRLMDRLSLRIENPLDLLGRVAQFTEEHADLTRRELALYLRK